MGTSEKDLKRLCPNATIMKGLAIHGTIACMAEQAINNWIQNGGY